MSTKKVKANIAAKNQNQRVTSKKMWEKYINYLVCVLILFATYISLSPSVKCGFTNWDDNTYVTANTMVVSKTVPVKEIFTTNVSSNYHPFTILSLVWNYKFGKLNPQGYHYVNLVLHLFNTAMVFIFILLLSRYALAGKKINASLHQNEDGFNESFLSATIVALFFGIHPMHVESVTWISERKDVLYTFFFLASLISYLKYKEDKKIIWHLLSIVLFIFSCLSKGMAVVLPVILLLMDYFTSPNINSFINRGWKEWLPDKILFFLIALGFGILTFNIQHEEGVMSYITYFTPIQRMAFASYGATMYIIKLFAPCHLSAFYPYPSVDANHHIPAEYYLFPFLFIGIIAGFYLLPRFIFKDPTRARLTLLGLLFFFVSVLPVLQFIPIGSAIMADRYSYVSYIGLLFAISQIINLAWAKNVKYGLHKYVFAVLLILAALSFCYQTYGRTKVWMNSETLWNDVIGKYPKESPLAYSNLGNFYANEGHDLVKALANYNRALELNPNFPEGYYNRASLYSDKDSTQLALLDFAKAIQLAPSNWLAYANRGIVFDEIGNYANALSDYNKALELHPKAAKVYNNRGYVYYKTQNYMLAIDNFTKAIALDEDFDKAYFNRANSYFAVNENEKAIADFTQFIRLKPGLDVGYNLRAKGYFLTAQYSSAFNDITKAVQLTPSASNFYNRALVEKAMGMGDAYLSDISKARQLGMKVDTLSYY